MHVYTNVMPHGVSVPSNSRSLDSNATTDIGARDEPACWSTTKQAPPEEFDKQAYQPVHLWVWLDASTYPAQLHLVP